MTSIISAQEELESYEIERHDLELPEVEKNNWKKTMEAMVPHLKHEREMRSNTLVYVFRQHIEVAHISTGYNDYLNLEEMIARVPLVYQRSNLHVTQDWLNMQYIQD